MEAPQQQPDFKDFLIEEQRQKIATQNNELIVVGAKLSQAQNWLREILPANDPRYPMTSQEAAARRAEQQGAAAAAERLDIAAAPD